MKKLYLGIFGLLISGLLTAQQVQLSSLYNMNKYEINPAVAGTENGIPLALSYRKAWMGIEGSPTEQRLSGHMKIAPRMGVGVRLFNGTQGPLRKTGVEATYAYHIPIDRNDSKISFGLSGIFYQYYLDKQSLEVEDPDDMALLGEEQKFLPDAAFGVYYSHHDYYVGASVYQLFQGRVRFNANDIADNRQIRHYFFTSGYNVYINNNFTNRIIVRNNKGFVFCYIAISFYKHPVISRYFGICRIISFRCLCKEYLTCFRFVGSNPDLHLVFFEAGF